MVGLLEGISVGSDVVGSIVGSVVGTLVGPNVGSFVGTEVGETVMGPHVMVTVYDAALSSNISVHELPPPSCGGMSA